MNNFEKKKLFWSNKKVFITGHTGFKGSWLSFTLKILGAKVYGYSLKPPTNPSLFNIIILNSDTFESKGLKTSFNPSLFGVNALGTGTGS